MNIGFAKIMKVDIYEFSGYYFQPARGLPDISVAEHAWNNPFAPFVCILQFEFTNLRFFVVRIQKAADYCSILYSISQTMQKNTSCAGLRKMFCPGGIAPIANDINIEFYTK
jgi:hypothetical protein